jgi:hypothetical protein
MNREQRTVLVISAIGAFLTPFLLSSVNIALPAIATGSENECHGHELDSEFFSLSAAVFFFLQGSSLTLPDANGFSYWGSLSLLWQQLLQVCRSMPSC